MITQQLFQKPIFLLLAIIVIAVSGISSWFVLPQLEDPTLGRRVGIVSVPYPGATSEQVETGVTIPVELQLSGLKDVARIRSNSQSGISNVVIELRDEVTDVDRVWARVRSQIADVRRPEQSLKPTLTVVPLKAFASIVGLSTTKNSSRLRSALSKFKDRLASIDGTEKVAVFGDSGEQIAVKFDPAKLATIDVSLPAAANQIEQALSSVPAAIVTDRDSELSVKIAEDPDAIFALKNSLIFFGRGESRRLQDIASIQRRNVAPATSEAFIDGKKSLVVAAMLDDQRRISAWDDEVQAVLRSMAIEYPDVEFRSLMSQRKHVQQRLADLLQNLLVGTAAVVLVVFVLMGWRCMLVVAFSLPLSALLVLTVMRWMGIPVHQMSVTGLIVSLGLLIDNAIVVVDDIRGRILKGESRRLAVTKAVIHLRLPLLGSTLTTVFAFLPIATLEGPPGEFVGTIAANVIIAITASFVLSMTIVPAMMGLIGINESSDGFVSSGLTLTTLKRLYERSLRSVFAIPVVGIIAGGTIPVMGFLAARELPEQFFPASDRMQLQIEVEQSSGATLASTSRLANSIQTAVSNDPAVLTQNWFVGESAPTFFYNVVPRRRATPFYAQAFVDLNPGTDIQSTVQRLQLQVDQQFPSARILVRQLEQGPPFDAPVELRIIGDDLATLQTVGSDVRRILAETRGVIHTRSDMQDARPSVNFGIKPDAAARHGLTPNQIAIQLYSATSGIHVGEVTTDDRRLPVVASLQLDQQHSLEQLKAMPLYRLSPQAIINGPTIDQRYSPVTLGTVAESVITEGSGAVVRINGQRVNEIKAYLQSGVLASDVVDRLTQKLEDLDLPEGYSVELGGESEKRQDAVNRLIANGVVLFALMVLTLVLTFQSIRSAAMIAIIGGLTAGLGPFALAAVGYPFGFMAIVGTMGLIGVAINDSIVVLAAIRADPLACKGDRQALTNVVSHSTRHILATTFTTIAGFLPLIVSGGRFWPPLAICIAGGVGGATLLALYMVPSMHLLTLSRSPSTAE